MLSLVRLWILLSTALVAGGWILSALHALNRIGYTVFFALAALAVFLWQRNAGWRLPAGSELRKVVRRFKRPAPFLFLVLVSLSFLGGILYAPYNSDTFAYRTPRILHWLAQEQWHWIHTGELRMNIAGCGYEWMATPLVLFARSDRWLFVLNWLPYLLLPGMIFCLLKYAGVRARVAWHWAWILASGWCFVLQAGSVVNDAFAAIYALAAVTLAFKSGETKNPADFWLSFFAVALLTGVKQVNLPLVLLWAVAALPQWRLVLAKPLTAVAATLLGVTVSAAPLAYFCWRYTGTWSGIPALAAANPSWHIELDSPWWGIVGNIFCLPLQNLMPPLFPWNHAWNHAMDQFVQTPFGSHFNSFEHFGTLGPGLSEASAGIGLTVVLLTVLSFFAARRLKRPGDTSPRSKLQLALTWLPWGLLIVFMAKVGESENARHLSPYYVFFFPSFLAVAGHAQLVRKVWWQKTALLCLVAAAGLLVIDNNRPLFPAETLFTRLKAAHPASGEVSALLAAYSMHTTLEKIQRQVAEAVPPNEKLVGYAAIGNAKLESALWWPFGSRRVIRVIGTDTPEQLAASGVHYVVIENAPTLNHQNIDDWLTNYHATIVTNLVFRREGGDSRLSHVYVTHLGPKPQTAATAASGAVSLKNI